MTDKCKRRMNGREEYITTKTTQRGGRPGRRRRPRNKEAQRQEGGSYVTERGWRIPVLEQGVPSPWGVGPPDSVYFSSPKQAVTSSEPNFWTHSLQIHCNGLGPKTVTLQYTYMSSKMSLLSFFFNWIFYGFYLFIYLFYIRLFIFCTTLTHLEQKLKKKKT